MPFVLKNLIKCIVGGFATLGLLILVPGLMAGNGMVIAWGSIFSALATIMFVHGLKEIPANPPHVGLVTIWGKRYPVKKGEGLTLLAPYFPFKYDIVLIRVEKRNEDFRFTDIRCKLESGSANDNNAPAKSGGSVSADISITWQPTLDEGKEGKLLDFINSGKDAGVTSIMRDMLGEDIRQSGASRTWTEMTFATDELSVSLIGKLTGEEHGKENPTKEELKQFIKTTLQNGVSDIWDLGVTIRRLNVEKVEPEGELKGDAERAARERQQRTAEESETDTVVVLMEKYRKKFPNLSDTEILNAVQTERGKASRIIVDGSGGDMSKAAAIFTQQNRRK